MLCKYCLEQKTEYTNSKNQIKFYCKKCHRHRIRTRNRDFKQKCIEYKGSKCSNCGYDKCSAALDFHHTDESIKEFNISRYTNRCNFDEVKSELDKCVLLCANCHREEHFYTENPFVVLSKVDKKTNCIDCGITTRYTKRCKNCNLIFKRKDIPSKKQLQLDLIEFNSNLAAISRKYSVCHKTVRKWVNQYQLV